MLTTERLRAFWELTKPGITRLVLLTTATGFYLGSRGGVDLLLLGHTLLGTGLVAGGTNALNQYWERDVDARMRRTRRRPLPSGRLAPGQALLFAVAISMLGIVYLGLAVNVRAAAVVTVSLVSYIFLYTPLKKRTTLATLVGAVPGALPMLAGWVAAGGPVGVRAWTLFAILFLWQLPHFLALAWVYREDYRRGGLASLDRADPDGRTTGRQALLYTLALVGVSLLPTLLGLTGAVYLLAAVALGLGFLMCGAGLALACTERRAGRLFMASIAYLPLLLAFMVVDKAGF
jgi:protoheme IX farnesyltransferase